MQISRDTISGLFLLGLSIVIYLQSLSFPMLPEGYPGPSLFPQILALSLGLLGLGLCVSSLREKPEETFKTSLQKGSSTGWGRILGAMATVALYPLAYPYLTPLQSSLGIPFNPMIGVLGLCLFLLALIAKVPLRAALLASVGGPVLVYVVFTQLLGVAL